MHRRIERYYTDVCGNCVYAATHVCAYTHSHVIWNMSRADEMPGQVTEMVAAEFSSERRADKRNIFGRISGRISGRICTGWQMGVRSSAVGVLGVGVGLTLQSVWYEQRELCRSRFAIYEYSGPYGRGFAAQNPLRAVQ